jgi:hypothetical protein
MVGNKASKAAIEVVRTTAGNRHIADGHKYSVNSNMVTKNVFYIFLKTANMVHDS